MGALTTFEHTIEGERTVGVRRGPGLCWSKYGVEAGESVDAILDRKESERLTNGGLFLWGIGSNVGPALRSLLRSQSQVDVWFSAMRSRPKLHDQTPGRVVVWSSGEALDGRSLPLPGGSVVTSRASSAKHFALVCSSESPLRERSMLVNAGDFENWVSGAQVGHSQVTSIVRMRNSGNRQGTRYERGFSATLVAPYLITLTDGYEVAGDAFAPTRAYGELLALRDFAFATGSPVRAGSEARVAHAEAMFDLSSW